MNKQAREALDAYYVEAESWAQDRQDELRNSRRTAWIVAAAAVTVAVLLAIALVVLMPLKTVQPYTLLVDRNTGYVQALNPIEPERISGDAALTQSFLVQYVIARESFDIDSLQPTYTKVALWSAETARANYVAAMQANNPQSPLTLYPRTTIVETRVKSVSSVGQNVAMVRFETQRRDAGGRTEPPRAWVALIRYRYSGEPMRTEDRFINPLGFQVVRYRRDAETLPPEPVAETLPAGPGRDRPAQCPAAARRRAGPAAAPPGAAGARAVRNAFFLGLALLAAPLAAQVQPRSAGGDPRVQVVDYSDDQVVQLQAMPGYQLTVEFGPDEQIESVAVGDSAAWQATPNRRGDHLFVKPIQAGISTNMTVVTSVRVYLFELTPFNGPTSEIAFTVRFSYPDAGSADATQQAEAEQILEGRYRVSGARSLRPSRISDDGRHTYIEWPRDRSIPAVYAIDAQGREALVNGMMRDDIFVIDSVAQRLVFRIDRATARATRVEQRAR